MGVAAVPEAVTIGETMVVMNPAHTGSLRYVHTYSRSMGGAETNVAIGLVRLGHSCGWISRLGEDEFGRYVVNTLRGEGVETAQVRLDPGAPTGLYFKERPAVGDPSVFYYRRGSAASRMTPADLDPAYIQGARLLHVTGITPALSDTCREAVLTAMDLAREAGLTVSFDPNFRRRLWSEAEARPVMLEMARRADIVLPGADEGQMLTGEEDPERMARALLALGLRLAVIKLGPEGALVGDAEGCHRVAGFPLTPVDTVGAGDAFAAAFLAGVLEGRPAREAARRACAAGALVTQVVGDWEGIPDTATLEAFLERRQQITR